MIEFEIGKTYWTRSPGDHDCIYRFTVEGRTAKTIRLNNGNKVKTCRVSVDRDVEIVFPQGKYSMAPVLAASDTEELFPSPEPTPKGRVVTFPTEREEIEPGVYDAPPSPLHTAIYAAIKGLTVQNSGHLVPNLKTLRNENAISLVNLTRLTSLYNEGQRWIEF